MPPRLLGWSLTDTRFLTALDLAGKHGLELHFDHQSLPFADHPNTVRIELTGQHGAALQVVAKSVGGGSFLVSQVGGFPVALDGKFHVLLLSTSRLGAEQLVARVPSNLKLACPPALTSHDQCHLCQLQLYEAPAPAIVKALQADPDMDALWVARPVFQVPSGELLFRFAADMVQLAQSRQWSLGEVALQYEMELLRITRQAALTAMVERLQIMLESVRQGLDDRQVHMQLLTPSAGGILRRTRIQTGGRRRTDPRRGSGNGHDAYQQQPRCGLRRTHRWLGGGDSRLDHNPDRIARAVARASCHVALRRGSDRFDYR